MHFFVFFMYCSYAIVYKYTHVYYVYQDEWIVKMCFWWVNQKNNNNNKILGPTYLRPRDLHRFLCPSISVRITFNSSWASEHQFVLTITCLITKFIICTYTYTYTYIFVWLSLMNMKYFLYLHFPLIVTIIKKKRFEHI